VHAIWFSILVPLMVAAVWIWPKTRSPKFWFGLFLLASLATVIWLGNDLIRFLQVKGTWDQIGLRAVYLFLSEPDKPVLQLVFGLLLAGLFSRRLTHLDPNQLNQKAAAGL
jgi:hypothetical protein